MILYASAAGDVGFMSSGRGEANGWGYRYTLYLCVLYYNSQWLRPQEHQRRADGQDGIYNLWGNRVRMMIIRCVQGVTRWWMDTRWQRMMVRYVDGKTLSGHMHTLPVRPRNSKCVITPKRFRCFVCSGKYVSLWSSCGASLLCCVWQMLGVSVLILRPNFGFYVKTQCFASSLAIY